MEEILRIIETLTNLKHVKRAGPTLFAGIPVTQTESIAEHSFMVMNLCLLLGNKTKGVNIGNLLMNALVHDWSESVVGDVPSDSKSYQSYFSADIREIFKQAEENILNKFIKDADLKIPELNETEVKLLDYCDKLALALELVDFRQKGIKHKWITKMFNILIVMLGEYDSQFTTEIVKGLKDMFENGMDNYYLTKATDPVNLV